MSEAISEQIIREVVETLATDLTWMNVRREEQTPQSAADGDCVVIPGNPEPMDEAPCGFDQFRMRIGIACYAISSETEVTGEDDARLASIASDVRKTLRKDLHRGNLADNTIFDVADQFNHQTSPPFVLITINVQYRTLFADPYSQGG